MILTHTCTGARHLARRAPCEDAVAVKQFGNYSLLLLSDGCSSSAFGGEAAHHITNHIIDFVQHPTAFLDTDAVIDSKDFIRYCMNPENVDKCLRLIMNEIDSEVQEMCRRYRCQRKDLCCTLIAAFVEYHPESKSNTAVIITVGDGFVAAYNRKHRDVTLVSKGENRSNNPCMTYFCTSANAIEFAHVYGAESFDTLLLSSDGITHAVDINNRGELTDFTLDVINANGITDAGFSKAIDRLLCGYVKANPAARNLDDDCSLICYTTDKRAYKKLVKNYKNTI